MDIKDEMLNSMDMDLEKEMTPLKIKDSLDKYIIGQDHVKRAVAIALSDIFINLGTRYRKRMCLRSNVEDLKSHNLMIIGKSGSGKTEVFDKIIMFRY